MHFDLRQRTLPTKSPAQISSFKSCVRVSLKSEVLVPSEAVLNGLWRGEPVVRTRADARAHARARCLQGPEDLPKPLRGGLQGERKPIQKHPSVQKDYWKTPKKPTLKNQRTPTSMNFKAQIPDKPISPPSLVQQTLTEFYTSTPLLHPWGHPIGNHPSDCWIRNMAIRRINLD